MRWQRLSDDKLLDLRLCELPLRLKGTQIEGFIKRLYAELGERGIRYRPRCWLAEEWFSPDQVPGIAIPFYLAHPRLMKLERKYMLEVEGGTETSFMRILRHEAGHALDTAYRLHFRRRWQKVFGSFAMKYPDSYQPKPNSKKFVLHLNGWYAQAHPAEDYAETFAVWLTPGSRWRRRYQGWPALKKLECLDELMTEIAGRPPMNKKRSFVEPLSQCRTTLREHYTRKREHYAVDFPGLFDRDLRRLFSSEPRHRGNRSAAAFLRLHRRRLCERIAEVTGVHAYTINHVLVHMMQRCRSMKLRLVQPQQQALEQVLVMLAYQTIHAVRSGCYKFSV